MNPVLALFLRLPIHGLGLFVTFLPRSWEVALGRFCGRVTLLVDRKRPKIAAENIRRCLPELGPAGWDELLKKNFEHYGILVLELSHMFSPIPGHWRRYVEKNVRVVGLDRWKKAHARGKGELYVSTHIANWEFCAAIGSIHGMDVMIVTRNLKPRWLHDWMEKVRLTTGVSAAYQPRTMPTVMKHLRKGAGTVFVLDQYMPPPMGSPLRLFGVMVDTLAAVAPLARRTGAAILPVSARRGKDGIVTVTIEPEVTLSESDADDNQRLATIVEDWMRANPEQSLWGHRRFKHVDWSAVDRKTQNA